MLSRKSIILKSESNGVLDYNWNYPLSINLFNKMLLYDAKFAEFYIMKDLEAMMKRKRNLN
ncbi:hypothetical protein [Clostridium haemolyticum]|uniref:hypothetical protein n=1 Tax=Clostridium haemolyticum TaxID=84025 RepID=UPI001FBB61AC|nr:hypothetical protein [Clostridium haemolyticum]